MTEYHPDDEAVSALLDGEGDTADHAHLEGCPACQARLDELRGVSQAVGAAVASRPAVDISAAVSRALAEAPLTATQRTATRRTATRRAPAPRPSRWSPKGPRVLAIAAAVVVVAGVASIVAVTSNHGTNHNTAASAKSATAAQAPASAGAASVGAPSSALAPAPQAASSKAAPPDLGEQSDPAALAAALHTLEKQGLPGAATTILAPPACAPDAASGAGLDSGARAIFAAPLRWQGQDAQVLIFALPTAGGGQTAVVVDNSCKVLTTVPL